MSSRASISSLRRPSGWARQFFGATHQERAIGGPQDLREVASEKAAASMGGRIASDKEGAS